jgi:hypothetical protein
MLELPGNLVGHDGGVTRSSESDRFRGVGGCTQGMRAHVGDARSLCSSTSRGHRRRRSHGVCRSTSHETTANFASGIKLTPGKCPSPSDGIAWAIVVRRLHLEKAQDALSTVRRPRCDEAAIIFAQRLGGRHTSIFARERAGRSSAQFNARRFNRRQTRRGAIALVGLSTRSTIVGGSRPDSEPAHVSALRALPAREWGCVVVCLAARRNLIHLFSDSPTRVWNRSDLCEGGSKPFVWGWGAVGY